MGEDSRSTVSRRVSEGFLEERRGYQEMNQVKVDSGANDRQWNARGGDRHCFRAQPGQSL